MLSSLHETLVQLFRERPSLAADLLTGPLGLALPAWRHVDVGSADFTEPKPVERRADTVVTLRDAAAQAVLGIVVEIQLDRDTRKRWTWPTYLASLRERRHCPVVLLVVCPDAAVARWCARPITLGPGWVLQPSVIGPGQVPVIIDTHQAHDVPELVVLSALAHGGDSDGEKVLHALMAGLATVERDDAALYLNVVATALPDAARRYLEDLMSTGTFEFQSDFMQRFVDQGRAQGRAEGEARGEAEAVLTVLAARGIDVPADARARVTECTDLDQLRTWIRRAVTADSVHNLFDQP